MSAENGKSNCVQMILSGTAAGVIGASYLAGMCRIKDCMSLDIGGTTADVALIVDGKPQYATGEYIGDFQIHIPSVSVSSIGDGGGSIAWVDDFGVLKVGPESAGSNPGPVCYGRGGTRPTITECTLPLGSHAPEGLAGGALKLDRAAAEAAIARDLARPLGLTVEEAAHGMLRIASATMMRAIRAVSVERGRDPRDFALLAFGGNGPLFAARIAAELGMTRIIVPPFPGVFSAFGLLVAETEHHVTRSLRMRLDAPDATRLAATLAALTEEGAAHLADEGFSPARHSFRHAALARYAGQSSELLVPLSRTDAPCIADEIRARFADEHERSYGFRAPPGEPVELMGLSVVARGMPDTPRLPDCIPPSGSGARTRRRAWFGEWTEVPVLDRASLSPDPLPGPAILAEYDATTLVPPGWTARLDAFGNILLTPAPAA
jgi:N-methylhydantoinase A